MTCGQRYEKTVGNRNKRARRGHNDMKNVKEKFKLNQVTVKTLLHNLKHLKPIRRVLLHMHARTCSHNAKFSSILTQSITRQVVDRH